MTDEERAEAAQQTDRADGELPAIPDGGLSEAMPEWLRRPPAWRGMAVPDVPSTTPEPVADGPSSPRAAPVEVGAEAEIRTPSAEPKMLLEPDRSPIDPSSLIEMSDLPAWLVGLGQRDLPVPVVQMTGSSPIADSVTETILPVSQDRIVLRSQESDASELMSTTDAPVGTRMRTLILVGVFAVIVVIGILIARFG